MSAFGIKGCRHSHHTVQAYFNNRACGRITSLFIVIIIMIKVDDDITGWRGRTKGSPIHYITCPVCIHYAGSCNFTRHCTYWS